LHPIEQTLVINHGSEIREYRFIETNFETRAPSTVAPTVFEPETELLSSAKPETRNAKLETTSPLPLTHSPALATPELEVEVLRLLNQAGADMGEQVSVSRTPEGRLHVEALVENAQRKNEILNALASVRNNPAVRIEVNTVAEALKRKPQGAAPAAPTVVEEIGASTNTIPVETDLRAFFSKRGYEGERLDNEVRQFSTRTVVRSREIMNHAWALRRLGQRFSSEELRNLDPEARAKWIALVRNHAAALSQTTKTLRQELSPIFPGTGLGEASSEPDFKTDADLVRAVERLFALCSANDHAINSAFAISPDTDKAAAIKTSQFWRSLSEAQSLAARVSRQ
jgi:hypothetical protein